MDFQQDTALFVSQKLQLAFKNWKVNYQIYGVFSEQILMDWDINAQIDTGIFF